MKEDFDLGKKIKSIRLEKSLTLEQLAEKTRFSMSNLSKIENGRSSPPIATLSKIAKALGVAIADFFKDDHPDAILAMTRVNERIKIARQGNFSGYSYESLNHKKIRRSFDSFLCTFPLKSKDKVPLFNHEGEEMIYVLQGELEFTHNNNVYELKKGDCIHFDSSYPHNAISKGNKEAKALLIICSQK